MNRAPYAVRPRIKLQHRESSSTGRKSSFGASNRDPPGAARPPAGRAGRGRAAAGHAGRGTSGRRCDRPARAESAGTSGRRAGWRGTSGGTAGRGAQVKGIGGEQIFFAPRSMGHRANQFTVIHGDSRAEPVLFFPFGSAPRNLAPNG
ncbi:hypothetical protein GQ55_1G111900 [Panicum hallii var. hallii]|uniref:Uncharacterized protein n=1 Tax=Panicum hallii var. hallii TaxID=1504633 RepID=A0A2T7F4I2_9POAL|nr:hypothetical protein GQ55_1G111900 [Panicum hallii var. hallii]